MGLNRAFQVFTNTIGLLNIGAVFANVHAMASKQTSTLDNVDLIKKLSDQITKEEKNALLKIEYDRLHDSLIANQKSLSAIIELLRDKIPDAPDGILSKLITVMPVLNNTITIIALSLTSSVLLLWMLSSRYDVICDLSGKVLNDTGVIHIVKFTGNCVKSLINKFNWYMGFDPIIINNTDNYNRIIPNVVNNNNILNNIVNNNNNIQNNLAIPFNDIVIPDAVLERVNAHEHLINSGIVNMPPEILTLADALRYTS